MSAFTASLVQLFTTFITLFSAVNRFATGLDNIGKVVEESSAAYADEARIQRQMKLNALDKELALTTNATAMAPLTIANTTALPTITG